MTEALFGTSESVSATAVVRRPPTTHRPDSNASDTRTTATVDAPRFDPAEHSVRRPLSAVQADELFGFTRSAAYGCEPRWPESCQQLLALAADRYDSVIRSLPAGNAGTLIGIVGTVPQSGCTTTAICLALRTAALGFKAALVDGNLGQGGLAAALEVDHFQSWGGLLATSESVASAIQSAGDVGVDLLLTDPLLQPVLESTARFRASLAAGMLRRKYERVVIDLGCPPTAGPCLAADLAAAMGIDLLIATAVPTSTATNLDTTIELLDRYGLAAAGVIEAV